MKRCISMLEPFEGRLILQPEALAFNGINPHDPQRGPSAKYDALHAIFKMVRKGMKESDCSRAIMVAHNATLTTASHHDRRRTRGT